MQFFIFLICVSCGILSGVFYDFLYVLRCAVCGVPAGQYSVKDKIFTAFCDILYCAALAALYIGASVLFEFPDLRLYMLAGCFIGVLLYMKSFHLFVAFFIKKLYNRRAKR